MVGDLIVFVHNMFQTVTWAIAFYHIVCYLQDPSSDSAVQWKFYFQLAQYEQSVDIVLSCLRLIPNNPITVL